MDHPEKRFAEKISRNAHQFTPSDQVIADYLLRTYPVGFIQNSSELARELNINVSTVNRFFQKIGYRNIKEATVDLRKDLQFLINSPLDRFDINTNNQSTQSHLLTQIMELELSNIQRTFETIDEAAMKSFIDLLGDQSKAIYVLGARKEHSLSFYFYHQLTGLRDSVRLLQPDNMIDQLSKMKKGDVLVVFDFRRYSNVHVKAAQYIEDREGYITVFADSPITPAAQFAGTLFLVKTKGISAFDSYTAVLALINYIFAIFIENYGEFLKVKCERIEELYSRFGIFSFQKKPS